MLNFAYEDISSIISPICFHFHRNRVENRNKDSSSEAPFKSSKTSTIPGILSFLDLPEVSIFCHNFLIPSCDPVPLTSKVQHVTQYPTCVSTYIFWTWNHYWILRTDMIGSPFYQNSKVCTFYGDYVKKEHVLWENFQIFVKRNFLRLSRISLETPTVRFKRHIIGVKCSSRPSQRYCVTRWIFFSFIVLKYRTWSLGLLLWNYLHYFLVLKIVQ